MALDLVEILVRIVSTKRIRGVFPAANSAADLNLDTAVCFATQSFLHLYFTYVRILFADFVLSVIRNEKRPRASRVETMTFRVNSRCTAMRDNRQR